MHSLSYSIIDKDIPLKKRVLAYHPDIELCDDNCELIYVFLNNLTSKCECSISEEESKDKIRDNALYQNQFGELEEFIYQINIYVMKCYKDIFKYKYFIKCYGGFIILGIIFIEIICTIIYFCKSRFYLKKYFFCVTGKFLNYLKKQKPNNKIKYKEEVLEKFKEPPRKNNKSRTKSNLLFNKSQNQNSNNLMIINNFNNINQSSNQKNIPINSNNKKSKYKRSKTHKEINLKGNNNLIINNFSLNDIIMNDDFDIDIKEFLITDPGDMDYDEALRRDNRSFCKFYCDKIFSEQIILNTFCNKEYLKPLPIKIMLLLLQIDLYLLINGLFYNEEYVNKKFELESDSFSKAIWRFLDNLFYAFLVGVIINYIIEFFFIEEKKIRVTLKREKDNIIILRYEMIQIIKELERKYLFFIIISLIISIITWYHISCFNNIYPHMKQEWLIFSIFIIICIQILSLIMSLVETVLRFISFKCKSEKLFKLSLLFS